MWSAFPDDAAAEDEVARRSSAPENEVPVALPLNRLLGRSDDVAIALVGLHVYSTGLAFTLVVRSRPSSVEVDRRLQELFWDHSPLRGGLFLFGVEFADGRRATNQRTSSEGVVFHPGGGSGGLSSIDQSWWLSPLPPEGPVRVVVRCDPLGIPETVTEFDGSAVRAAAADVVTLWPWEPPRDSDGPPPPPPADVPPDSWFAAR